MALTWYSSRMRKVLILALVSASLWLAACGGGGSSLPAPGETPSPGPSRSPLPFLPLKVGNTWTYACYLGTPVPGASTFPKTNQVIGSTTVGTTVTYEYQEQLPTSPTTGSTQIQLLANDTNGNTLLYGYMANPTASPTAVTPTVIIPHVPGPPLTSFYDYPAQGGGTISRVFCCTGNTNLTVFGVLPVSEYFDGSHVLSSTTDGYGYEIGKGAMEEVHNSNNASPKVDCLITATPSP